MFSPSQSLCRAKVICPAFVSAAFYALIAVASPAAADPSVSIEVLGTIAPRCANTGFAHAIAITDASKSGADVVRFNVDCNAPFRYSIASENGGLKLAKTAAAATGFEAEVPYTVSMQIPLNSGGTIHDTCTSGQIKQGAITCLFTHSGNAVSIGKTGEMRIFWGTSSKPLLAGAYEDKLVVTLAVRL